VVECQLLVVLYCNVAGRQPYSYRLLQGKMNVVSDSICSQQHGTRFSRFHHICIGSKPIGGQDTCYVSALSSVIISYSTLLRFITQKQQTKVLSLSFHQFPGVILDVGTFTRSCQASAEQKSLTVDFGLSRMQIAGADHDCCC